MYKPKVGAVAFVEFFSQEPKAAQRFFQKVFGWEIRRERVNDTDIYYFRAGNGPEGHIMEPMGPRYPPSTVAFVRVRSVDSVLARVVKNRGKVLVPKYEVPGAGCFAWFSAPGGTVHAVYQTQRRVKRRRVRRRP